MLGLLVQNYYNWNFYIVKTRRYKTLIYLLNSDIIFYFFKYYTIIFYSSPVFKVLSPHIIILFRKFIWDYKYRFMAKYKYKNLSPYSINIIKTYTYWGLRNYLTKFLYNFKPVFKNSPKSTSLNYVLPVKLLFFSFNKETYNPLVLYFFKFFYISYFSYIPNFQLSYSFFYHWDLLNLFIYNYKYYFKLKHF